MDGLLSLLSPEALASAVRPRVRTPAMSAERRARLRLAGTERVGPVTFHELLRRFGSAAAALAGLPDLARESGLVRPPPVPGDAELDREIAALAALGGRHLVWGDPAYPAALAALPDAPPALRTIGRLDLLERPMIAVVGARNASTNGRRFAATLAQELGAAGRVVVSGLARGIDTAAHQAALTGGTVAVLAGGVDIVYPPENTALYRAIGEQGLLLSEMPMGAVPQARHFPRRNRIISGLAAGVVVVEAALRSGSLITARCAADQGRDVLAVPGSPLDPRCRGTNALIRDGARLVESAADVLIELPDAPAIDSVSYNHKTSGLGLRTALREGARQTRGQASSERAACGQSIETTGKSSGDPHQDLVLQCLGPAPTPVDEIVRQCQVSAAAVQAILLDLELAGRLERHRGNAVSLL
jgi:DNA processing protein